MRILLLDSDIIAYKYACTHEDYTDWGDGIATCSTDYAGACDAIDKFYDRILTELDATEYISCISCPSSELYRYDIRSDYKSNRKGKRRPELLAPLKEYIIDVWNGQVWSNIEADDQLGLLAKDHEALGNDPIICTIDKDLKTVGSKMYNWDTDEHILLSDSEAYYFFLTQVLTGDPVDGYIGCRGVGKVKAKKVLDEAEDKYRKHMTFGEPNLLKDPYEFILWQAVVETYASKQFNVFKAIEQARLAYILRNPEDYNRKTGSINLWNPPKFEV